MASLEKGELPQEFVKTAKVCGLEELLKSNDSVYVKKNKILRESFPEGVEARLEEFEQGVKLRLIVKRGVKLKDPLFLCFGLEGAKETQFIYPEIILEENSKARIFSHCTFPGAEKAFHQMEGLFVLSKSAELYYEEHHYHGESSGVEVKPKLKVEAEENSVFESVFNLTQGTVGKTNIDLEVFLKKNAKTVLETKVLGKSSKDSVGIQDKVYMKGDNAKSLIKMRAAARNGGNVWMQGETYAEAKGCRGHVDCQEIVVGKKSRARAVPIVEVGSENARITHEASVGKVNQKELETLMTRGLKEEEATDLIIDAIMK
jgi:hypothetical protein